MRIWRSDKRISRDIQQQIWWEARNILAGFIPSTTILPLFYLGLAGFEIKLSSFYIFQIHLSNQEWEMLGKETNWISIKLNDLKIAQFYNPDIGNQHIGNNFMSFSIFFLSKNVVAINSKWADWGNTNELSNIQLYIFTIQGCNSYQISFSNHQCWWWSLFWFTAHHPISSS